jgi:hypothetical protein
VPSESDDDTDVVPTATAPKKDSKDKKTKTTKGKKQGRYHATLNRKTA